MTEEVVISVGSPSLPVHDELSLSTSLIEVLSIIAAVVLLLADGLRLIRGGAFFTWWSLPVVATGLISADLASGIVHWAADTWGSETMPLIGRRLLRPFRVHHVNPNDFLRRNWIDTNADVAMIVAFFLAAALFIPLDRPPGVQIAVFLFAFCVCGLPTNQVHQWAHRTRPPKLIHWLQCHSVLLSYEQHAMYHDAPYVANYCIATGWCNRPLTALHFFPCIERLIKESIGVQPRSDEQHFQRQMAASEADP